MISACDWASTNRAHYGRWHGGGYFRRRTILETARLGGVGHIPMPWCRRCQTAALKTRKYVKDKLQQYKFNVANSDKSVVQFNMDMLAERPLAT